MPPVILTDQLIAGRKKPGQPDRLLPRRAGKRCSLHALERQAAPPVQSRVIRPRRDRFVQLTQSALARLRGVVLRVIRIDPAIGPRDHGYDGIIRLEVGQIRLHRRPPRLARHPAHTAAAIAPLIPAASKMPKTIRCFRLRIDRAPRHDIPRFVRPPRSRCLAHGRSINPQTLYDDEAVVPPRPVQFV